MAAAVVDPQQSVVMRVANLPLVSSTYDLVSSAYVNRSSLTWLVSGLC
ncbi:adipose differentiation related protein, isoform CRA_c [Mus musculus]|nr:adipose differentiation related protein, isoform CRA_c [Mus musculus]